ILIDAHRELHSALILSDTTAVPAPIPGTRGIHSRNTGRRTVTIAVSQPLPAAPNTRALLHGPRRARLVSYGKAAARNKETAVVRRHGAHGPHAPETRRRQRLADTARAIR